MQAGIHSYITYTGADKALTATTLVLETVSGYIKLGFHVSRDMTKEMESVPENMLTIRKVHELLQELKRDEMLSVLKVLGLGEEIISMLKHIEELGFIDWRKLASLLLWLAYVKRYSVTEISPVEDPETGEILFTAIYIDGCDWEGWRRLSKNVKKHLVEEGFSDVASRVVLVCRDALQTLRG